MFSRKNKNMKKLPNMKNIKKRYSKEEIAMYNEIEITNQKKGIGLFSVIIFISLIAVALGSLGYLGLDDTNVFFQKTFYPEGLNNVKHAPPPAPAITKNVAPSNIQ